MKRSFICLLFASLCFYTFAQAPEGFNYQGIARDKNGKELALKNISILFTIIMNSDKGTPVYREYHNVTTNSYGLFSLKVGSGKLMYGNFSYIDWTTGKFFLRTEMDPTGDTNFEYLASSQLLSVPFALVANWTKRAKNDLDTSATNELQMLRLNNDTLYLDKGGFVSLAGYNDKIEIQKLKTKLNSDSIYFISLINTNTSNIVIERNARISGDQNIKTKQVSDSTFIVGLITTETNNRSNADNLLQLANTAETNARINADNSIRTKMTSDSNAIHTIVNTINTNLITETNTRIAADNILHTKQVSDSTYFDGLITTESNARINGDNSIMLKMSSDSNMLRTMINTTNTNLTTETNARINGDNNLKTKIIADSTFLIGLINNKQDKLTAGAGISINGTNVISATDPSLTNELQTLSRSNDTIYLSNGGGYVKVPAPASGSGWSLVGNAGNVDTLNFIGTTDNVAFNIRVNNQKAGRIDPLGTTMFGYKAGDSNTNTTNTAFGFYALHDNILGDWNTGVGNGVLWANTTGSYNTAIGYQALTTNTTGYNNTATGTQALNSNTLGYYNTASGTYSLYGNTIGNYNTANGTYTLLSNTIGNFNTAIGNTALRSNVSGNSNVAVGNGCLYTNVSGSWNTATGLQALYYNTGNSNTANGQQALVNNSSGSWNTGIGYASLFNNTSTNYNTALGYQSGGQGTTHTQNTYIGARTYLDNVNIRSNVTMIGYLVQAAQCTANNQILLGNTAITDIRAAVTGITAYSDARYKTNIKENVAGLDFILKLKPVTYTVKPNELNNIWCTPDSLKTGIDFSETEKQIHIGFLAQDVEKAAKESGFDFPGLDVPKNKKEVYSLRYVDFIMPLVKSVQEQQILINSLQEENKQLKERLDKIEQRIK